LTPCVNILPYMTSLLVPSHYSVIFFADGPKYHSMNQANTEKSPGRAVHRNGGADYAWATNGPVAGRRRLGKAGLRMAGETSRRSARRYSAAGSPVVSTTRPIVQLQGLDGCVLG
jgi:hypothetical protein